MATGTDLGQVNSWTADNESQYKIRRGTPSAWVLNAWGVVKVKLKSPQQR